MTTTAYTDNLTGPAAWLRYAYPQRTDWHLCHETIYQALYHGGRGGLNRSLTKRLRTGRPLRKRRRRPAQRTPRYAVPARLIDQRPVVVETRSRVGDWEGDLIVGRHSRSAIATLVDRHSRLVRLVHLPHGHSADALAVALTRSLIELPATARQTLTWDQGSEMASHHQLAPLFSDGIYVAFAGAPWQRGSNENTNGLLRQYFPKGSDLSRHGPADLIEVEERLNNRPRKTLHWKTPTETFASALPS